MIEWRVFRILQLMQRHLEKCLQVVHLGHDGLCRTLGIVMVVIIEEDRLLGVGKTTLTKCIVEI